jgi:ribonuclease BN (tRNA processing enzyme)
MDIRILGAHNCESESTRMSGILIDDRLVLDAGGLTSSLSIPAQLELKAVLLTHQHYDHVRDILALAMNFYLAGFTMNVYSTSPACEVITSHLFDGKLYPDFTDLPEEKPTINFTVIEPYRNLKIDNYDVLAVPVNHSVPTVGYQVTSPEGKTVFFTSDTGPGLGDCWQQVSPQLLVIECTASDRFTEFSRKAGHFTPGLLKDELIAFKEMKGYLPRVITVHMSPGLEEEIKAEIAEVSRELNNPVSLGYEGMQLHL